MIMASLEGNTGALTAAIGSLNSAIAGIGSAAGAQTSLKNALRVMGDQYEYNKAAATTAWNRSIQAWEMENAYNTPKAQRERLEAAGLNPALMYSNGGAENVGGSVNVPEQSGTSAVTPGQFRTGLENFDAIGVARQIAEIRNIDANTKKQLGETELLPLQGDLLSQQAALLASKNINEGIRTAILNFDVSFLQDTYKFRVDSAKQTLHRNIVSTQNLIEEGIALKNKNKLFGDEWETLKLRIENQQKANELLDLQIKAADLGMNLTRAEINKVHTEARMFMAVAADKGVDAALKQFNLENIQPEEKKRLEAVVKREQFGSKTGILVSGEVRSWLSALTGVGALIMTRGSSSASGKAGK